MDGQDILIGDRCLVETADGEGWFWATCVAVSDRFVQVSVDAWPAPISVLRRDVLMSEWPGERVAT